MANVYPQELLDVESMIDCVNVIFKDWMEIGLPDKNYAVKMTEFLGILRNNMSFLKERYRREAKVLLELTGEEVAT